MVWYETLVLLVLLSPLFLNSLCLVQHLVHRNEGQLLAQGNGLWLLSRTAVFSPEQLVVYSHFLLSEAQPKNTLITTTAPNLETNANIKESAHLARVRKVIFYNFTMRMCAQFYLFYNITILKLSSFAQPQSKCLLLFNRKRLDFPAKEWSWLWEKF
jgi:hypothetical protein